MIADSCVNLVNQHKPRAIVHFAAESHVDRSIHGPDDFIRTNVFGTFSLLEEARVYCAELSEADRGSFRLLHVSTDEVYGSLGLNDPPFCETTAYAPNSPYSASKAAADHLVRAYHHTYGLPTVTTNCSNNYGPYQFPEKLIPLVILNARAANLCPSTETGRMCETGFTSTIIAMRYGGSLHKDNLGRPTTSAATTKGETWKSYKPSATRLTNRVRRIRLCPIKS